MKTPMRPTLRDLQIGDKFYPASQERAKKKIIYEAIGKIRLHNIMGIAIRTCRRIDKKEEQDIDCSIEVIKLFFCLECNKKVGHGESYCNECVIV